MKLVAIFATLAAASSAVAQHGGGDLNDCGLGLELCNRVKMENLDCCTNRQDLITALATGGYMIMESDPERGNRMGQLAQDLRDRF